MSKIQWTEQTWNPIVGCTIVSPGCKNCYAMGQAHRLAHNPATPHYHLTTQMTKNAGPVWSGKVALAGDSVLHAPLHRKKPTMYFVNSMGDLFHESVPDEWIDRVFAIMALSPQHTFQVLTKRAERMRDYFANDKSKSLSYNTEARVGRECIRIARGLGEDTSDPYWDAFFDWPLSNVWLCVSAEDQEQFDLRVPELLKTPAAVRGVSLEPLLESIDMIGRCNQSSALHPYEDDNKLDWVIVGGESGRRARPCNVDWIGHIVDQCLGAGVPLFVKQLGANFYDEENGIAGARTVYDAMDIGRPLTRRLKDKKGGDPSEWPEDLRVREWPEVSNG